VSPYFKSLINAGSPITGPH